jgi:hypothetical protein
MKLTGAERQRQKQKWKKGRAIKKLKYKKAKNGE